MAKKYRDCDLRVAHIPQVPMKAFYVYVPTVEVGVLVMDALAEYDLFQFENNIKPDYENVTFLEMYDVGEWISWESEDGEEDDPHRYVAAITEATHGDG